jgi:hypothetical protein
MFLHNSNSTKEGALLSGSEKPQWSSEEELEYSDLHHASIMLIFFCSSMSDIVFCIEQILLPHLLSSNPEHASDSHTSCTSQSVRVPC